MNRSVSGTACILAALMILVLPINWLIAAIAAAAFHELCHYLAVIVVGGQVYALKIWSGGIVMETGFLTRHQELICAIAGPAGSLVLVFLHQLFPRTALCALIQGCFNLMPVYPLDGGRILNSVANIVLPQHKAQFLCQIAEWVFGAAVFLAGMVGTFQYHLGIVPILTGGVLLSKIISGKFPCIAGKLAVQ